MAISRAFKLRRVVFIAFGGLVLTAFASAQEIVAGTEVDGIHHAIAQCIPDQPCTVDVPAGNNLIDKPIPIISNLTLRSQSGRPDAVIRYASLLAPPDYMVYSVGSSTLVGTISAAILPKATSISHTGSFQAGDTILVTSSATGSPQDSQMTRAASSTVNGVTQLSTPLGRNIDPAQTTYYVFKVQPISNVRFENLDFQIPHDRPVFLQYLTESSIEGCVFENQDGGPSSVKAGQNYYGLALAASYNTTISHCTFTVSNLRLSYSTNVVVSSCTFNDCAGGQSCLYESNSCHIVDNMFSGDWQDHTTVPLYLPLGQHGDAVTLISSWNNQILGNTIVNSSCYGIWTSNGSGGNRIAGNSVAQTYTYCICDTDGVQDSIVGNKLSPASTVPWIDTTGTLHPDGWAGGICVMNYSPSYPAGTFNEGLYIAHNQIDGGGLGIYIADSTDVQIAANRSVNATLAPFVQSGNTNLVLTNNNF
jgi:parallel beta-helix repeat protein